MNESIIMEKEMQMYEETRTCGTLSNGHLYAPPINTLRYVDNEAVKDKEKNADPDDDYWEDTLLQRVQDIDEEEE